MTSAVGSGVDRRLRVGALALVLAALMTIPDLFSVYPPTDPGHNRDFALAANGVRDRLGWILPAYAFVPVIRGMFAARAAVVGTPAAVWGDGRTGHEGDRAGCLLPGVGFATVVVS